MEVWKSASKNTKGAVVLIVTGRGGSISENS